MLSYTSWSPTQIITNINNQIILKQTENFNFIIRTQTIRDHFLIIASQIQLQLQYLQTSLNYLQKHLRSLIKSLEIYLHFCDCKKHLIDIPGQKKTVYYLKFRVKSAQCILFQQVICIIG